MFWARLTALAFLVLTVVWIGSGYLRPSSQAATNTRTDAAEKPLFRVVAIEAKVEPHARSLTLTGRTQSDQRVNVTARTNGIVKQLARKRGARVEAGDLIVELSDEAREANVAQAKARLAQRAAELEARETLAKRGNYPTLNLEQLRAEKQAAEAALATAEAELLRANILAPVAGIINDVAVEVGQGVQMGASVADLIVPDPMLAIIEVPERRVGGLKIGDGAQIRLVTGETRSGTIRFISRKPTGQTRTYRVDVVFSNADAAIPDGIAAEVSLILAPVEAARVPRSALVFSSEGQLGLRTVDGNGIVGFVPVGLVDDEEETIWVSGVKPGTRVITRGQEFIREGRKVEAVSEPQAAAPAKP